MTVANTPPMSSPPPQTATSRVPPWLDTAAAWSWRLIVVAIPVAGFLWLANYLAIVIIPLVVSLFAAAILEPVRRTFAKRMPEHWASACAFLLGLILASLIVGLAVAEIGQNFDELVDQTETGLTTITEKLANSPLKIKPNRVDQEISSALGEFRDRPGQILSGALSIVSTTGGLLAGLLLALISTIFLMFDRRRLASGLVAPFGPNARIHALASMGAAWRALVSYVQVTLLEALFDSILIAGAAAAVGVPVAFALGAVVFMSVFVPTVGAIVSGALVTLVTYVTQGSFAALTVGLVVIVVQQIDANILYPLLTSRRLSIHPLASILLVAVGGLLGGIFGAFVAVPLVGMALAGWRERSTGPAESTALAPPE